MHISGIAGIMIDMDDPGTVSDGERRGDYPPAGPVRTFCSPAAYYYNGTPVDRHKPSARILRFFQTENIIRQPQKHQAVAAFVDCGIRGGYLKIKPPAVMMPVSGAADRNKKLFWKGESRLV